MVTVELPDEVGGRLEALARSSGQSASFHAERAIAEYLGDLEDYEAAQQELQEVEAGRSVPVPLQQLLKTYGVAD